MTTTMSNRCDGGGLFLHADTDGQAVCPDCGATVGGTLRQGRLFVVLAEHVPATRTIRLSAKRIAFEGERYFGQFLNLRVVWTSFEGEQHVGVVESFTNPVDGSTGYPIVRFFDGGWTRLDLVLHAVGSQQPAHS